MLPPEKLRELSIMDPELEKVSIKLKYVPLSLT